MISTIRVKNRLEMLGYTATAQDDGLIEYISMTVEKSVLRTINALILHADLENIVIDKIVGEFLINKKNTGQDIGINVDAAVKSITEGDTNVQYETKHSAEAKIDSLISWLIKGRDDVVLSHRCIRW